MHMPGPDGVAVIKEARRLQPDLFTLIITGHTGKYPVEELMADGTASNGMAAKLEAAIAALDGGVECVRIASIAGIKDPTCGTLVTRDGGAA